ncbi:damage-control phosphatase ARMT1 family protein [Streptomyces sp. 4N509B]|uniref:damage-control phosphatase ARMT1 family protein n=1 Tax=Streptomyces sp. 4N509B TaxID=3457413 RepID=UPI003FD1AC01
MANTADVADATDTTNAATVVTGAPGSFAWSVLARRHPTLIRQVDEAHPYGPVERAALEELLAEIGENGAIRPLPATAPDRGRWERWGLTELAGRSWFEVPFLWAESYFYRRILGAVGYFEPGGPWQGVDPFAPAKRSELASDTVDEELRALDALEGREVAEQGAALLQGALWGNRADLGFLASAPASASASGSAGDASAATGLVADDSAALWELLDPEKPPAAVAVVADNAGRELIPDLLLVDHLLRHTRADAVDLHVKPHPYFVSDAVTADLLAALERLRAAAGRAGEAGARLWQALRDGRLAVRTHPFWCAPLSYRRLPEDLRRSLASCSLTILKGDLNYRRLVGDRLWPPTTPFAELTAYFPTPVAALRTLKCDVVCGLTPEREAALDATGETWRSSGQHALVQVRT